MIFQRFSRLVVLVCCLLAAQVVVFSQPQTQSPLPAPTGFVNDYAGVIDALTKERLEARLKRLRETTNPPIEMAVAVVRTINGEDIFDYSLKVYRGWGIGAKGDGDNPGLLLFVAVDDRKYFTQVSRDLEGDLTDGEAGQIQRNVLVPAFRQGQYAKGIEDTLNAYITNIAESRGFDASSVVGQIQQPTPRTQRPVPRGTQRNQLSLGTCCLVMVVLFILLFMMSGRGRGGRGGRGGFGGGDLLSALVWGSILSNATRGGWSGGGFGGSSGDGGWGDSGGGFGGFGGGGDAGGGGAGGDW